MAAATGAPGRASREAYFTASQGELIWARFRRNRAAMVGAWVLLVLALAGFFAPFLSPYDPTIAGRDRDSSTGRRRYRASATTMAARGGPSSTRWSAPARSRPTSAGSPR